VKLGVSIARYARPFLRPLATSNGLVREREGLILSLTDAEGRVGKGEAAPISWIDDESLDDAASDLAQLGGDISQDDDVFGADDSRRVARLAELSRDFVPSARAALDAATLDLASRRAGTSAATRLGAVSGRPIPLNALVVEAEPDEVARAVSARIASGYRVVKLKVGAADPTVDVARVAAARAALGQGCLLRLDANAAWCFEVARSFLQAIGSARIDYMEEPLADPTAAMLAELRTAAPIPLAIDESLERLGGADGVIAARCCDAIVLKPARAGGPTAAVEVGRRLLASGLRVVLTDAIETKVGRAVVVHAASALAAEHGAEVIGLGGLELLARDLTCDADDEHATITTLVARGPGLDVSSDVRMPSK